MKRVTRAVRPEDLPDLLQHPPRATLAFVDGGQIQAIPVAFRFDAGRYLVGLPDGDAPPGGRVKLLVDDGPWYFDLRGFWARGSLAPIDSLPGAPEGISWFELTAEKVRAWHYGSMRES